VVRGFRFIRVDSCIFVASSSYPRKNGNHESSRIITNKTDHEPRTKKGCSEEPPFFNLPARTTASAAVASATAASAITATPAAATTAASAAVFTRAGFVNDHITAVIFLPVKLRDRVIGIVFRGHFHKSKTTRAAGFTVENYVRRFNCTRCRKIIMQILIRYTKREVSNV